MNTATHSALIIGSGRGWFPRSIARRRERLGLPLLVFWLLLISRLPGVSGTVLYENSWFFDQDSKQVPGVPVRISFTWPHSALDYRVYGQSVSVSNVTFSGFIVVSVLEGGWGWLNNYDNYVPLSIHFPTGARAFAAFFSSYLPTNYPPFQATVTTDLGDTFTFLSGPNPAFTWRGFICTDSFYNLTYSDGAAFSPYHEELIDRIDLVLNPAPNLKVSLATTGQVDVTVNGSKGQTVAVETSTNLVTWQALATNTLANDQWIYSDNRTKSEPMRYYRTSLR
jgi:hypothetical protein